MQSGIVDDSIDGYGIGDVTILNLSIVPIAYDTADHAIPRNAGIGEGDVQHRTVISLAKQSMVTVIIIVAAALIDADTADSVAVAVEGALEGSTDIIYVSADGGVIVLGAGGAVPGGVVGVGNVGTQLEELAAVVVAAVDGGGQGVELAGK